ncbi:Smt3-specific protease [Ascosphaera acerosa]|nr:Smt3-specific protease [Ascosphaera acerosa]
MPSDIAIETESERRMQQQLESSLPGAFEPHATPISAAEQLPHTQGDSRTINSRPVQDEGESSIVPAVARGVGVVLRGLWRASGYGWTLIERTLGGARRRVVESEASPGVTSAHGTGTQDVAQKPVPSPRESSAHTNGRPADVSRSGVERRKVLLGMPDLEREARAVLSSRAKEALQQGGFVWQSPAQRERERKKRIEAMRRHQYEQDELGKDRNDSTPHLELPCERPFRRMLITPSEDALTAHERTIRRLQEKAEVYDALIGANNTAQAIATRRQRRRETEQPWWMRPDPLGPTFSSTSMWQEWVHPAPSGPTLNPVNRKWRKRVEKAIMAPDRAQVAKSVRGDPLTRYDLFTCFRQREWLNDEVINAYLALIVQYGNRQADEDGEAHQVTKASKVASDAPRIHAFNSFFFSNLRDRGYASVRRWATRAKIGGRALLTVDTVFVPVHHHAHWTLLIVRPKARTIEYLDSLGGVSAYHVRCIQIWLAEELGNCYHDAEWRVLQTISAQQNNSSDCGVFLLTNAKIRMLGDNINFGPGDIPEIRRRIVAELLHGDLDGDFESDDEDEDQDSETG